MCEPLENGESGGVSKVGGGVIKFGGVGDGAQACGPFSKIQFPPGGGTLKWMGEALDLEFAGQVQPELPK